MACLSHHNKLRLLKLCFVVYFKNGGMIWRYGLFVFVYLGLTPQQQPGSYQGGEMMMMKSVFWWRKSEYPGKPPTFGGMT